MKTVSKVRRESTGKIPAFGPSSEDTAFRQARKTRRQGIAMLTFAAGFEKNRSQQKSRGGRPDEDW
jgi:hypothetical protein